MERKYYRDIGYKPYLFFLIFGVSGEDLEVSRERHLVDGLPEGLDIRTFTRKEQGAWIDGWFSGAYETVLKQADPELYERCRKAEVCSLLQGHVEKDATLDYMRNAVGIVQAFVDKGAAGILDAQTISLYSPETWTERFFGKEVDARRHAVILFSEEENGTYWIHTRGMAEFGRPDIGIRGVPEDKLREYGQLADQMVFCGGQGAFFAQDVRLRVPGGKTFLVHPEFINDFDNEDYNNAWYDVTVLEGEKE